jgi:transposase
VILDKGFASKSNIEALEKEELKFITPLPRKSSYIDYTIERFHEKRPASGTIALIENTEQQPSGVYTSYKTRGQVETMIDALKNLVQADRTYMQNSQSLEGWMFINHIALQWYYPILQRLKENELNKQYAPADFLMMLSEIKKVKINQPWFNAGMTKKTADLLHRLNILPIT